ncbi:hypothetical protein CWR48_15615 [Oceanobacillus arenosus]|uniref:Uncharacterized protein n=1 Tax=Oceanobacillus arenosus TaxID=1229153 RepID=A0A3D8PP69_9BACI|nr:hypothetical protein [Oceanobacillus arenosus]RDW17028.1 hypothetical protein CWR48_15615 [Oceanobacillus arenosus]
MDPLKQLIADKKEQLKPVIGEIRELKKIKTENGIYDKITKLEKMRSELEGSIKRFGPSKMQPMQVGIIVINYKLYTQFIKKLKGFVITEEILEDKLVIKYYKGNIKGELQLNDLSPVFPEGSVFPEGKLQETSIL